MRRFKASDLEDVNRWLALWGMEEALKEEDLSRIGFIVPRVACGFLYKTEGNRAFLECYVQNPMASKEERRHAEKKITETLIELAKRKGIKRLIVLTRSRFISYRAKKLYGFQVDEKVIFLSRGI